MARRVSIFGSTGSIGCNTVDLILRDPEAYDVIALTGGQNIKTLADQARRLRADVAVTADASKLEELRAALSGSDVRAAAGAPALAEAADMPVDWVMSAIVGAAGLKPGLVAARQGATLALANKETLVAAGALLLETAHESGATVLPVDSEHSAVFQALIGEDINAVERVVITASGGAFRDWSLKELASATPEQAATHPNWSMGQRITIDSASLFNKALELVEARQFFGFRPDQIETVIHPESIVHAIVGFADGGMMAHMGAPDMRHAIGFALHWPDRKDLPVERIDFAKLGQLTFRPADAARHPALRLAREVMEAGGLAGAIFNGAKEAALDGFIAHEIGFLDMAGIVEEVLAKMSSDGHIKAKMTLEHVEMADAEARRVARELIAERAG